MKTTVIIPAYNEDVVVGSVVSSVRREGYENVLVVDDGSIDKTGDCAKSAGAYVASHVINRGKGAAVKTGIEIALLQNSDIIVTMDADGQHHASDIEKLVRPIVDKEHIIVLGVRNFNNIDMPRWKMLINRFANVFTKIITGISVSDSQSGFRAYSSEAARLILQVGDGYEYDSMVIREIAKNKMSFTEIPITTIYTEYSKNKLNRQGVINGLKSMFRILLSIIS